MQINSFRYVIAAAEHPTLSAAAQSLFISQPALSQQIRNIETEIGAPIFERNGHTLKLTSAGKAYIDCGRRILQAYDTMEREIKALSSASKDIVRVGISPFYSQYYLPKFMPDFIAKYPEIQVDIDEDISANLEIKLLEGRLDFCAIPLKPRNKQLDYEILRKEQIYVALPHGHPLNNHYPENAQKNEVFPTIDLSLLKNEPFIRLKKIQKFTALSDKICAEAGFEPRVICETLNWDTVHMMIASGLGVGFVPDMLAGTIADEEISPCYYRLSPGVFRDYAIAQRRGEILTDSAKLLKKELQAAFKRLYKK